MPMQKRVPFAKDPLNWVALGVVILGLTLVAGFFVLRANTPSDGARMIITNDVWGDAGVVITPWQSILGEEQSSLEVLTVNGVRVSDLAQAAVAGQPNPVQADYQVDREAQYVARRAIRDNSSNAGGVSRPQALLVQATLRPFPFDVWFAQNWLLIFVTMGSMIIAGIVFFRHPSDRTTRAMVLWVPGIFASQIMYSLGLQIGDFVNPLNLWWFMITASLGYILTLVALLRFAFEFTRPPERVAMALRNSRSIVASYIVPYSFFFGFLIWQWLADPNALRWFGKWRTATGLIAIACISLSLLVAAWSYVKTNDYATRQKIRWIVYAGGVVGLVTVLLNSLPALLIRRPIASLTTLSVLFFIFQLTIAYAILRYGYLEVDLFINRTLVIGVMSALLALFYFGALVVVQVLFERVIPSRQGRADIVIVVTTLIGIALFNPVRNRAQRLVDRVFFRQKYEAARRITAFTSALRDDAYADMGHLTADLLAVTRDVARSSEVGLWLRDVTRKGS
jgi:hypothetical protein